MCFLGCASDSSRGNEDDAGTGIGDVGDEGTQGSTGAEDTSAISAADDADSASTEAQTDSSGEVSTSDDDGFFDDSTDDGQGDDTTGGPPTCGGGTWTFEPSPVNVMFVLDKSGSMMTNWLDGGALVTRWNTLHRVVEAVATSLDMQVNFGAKLFPRIDAGDLITTGACEVDDGVEVAVAPMNAANVLAGIPAANATVLGGTPATDAIVEAVEHLLTLPEAEPRALILVTDGEANCVAPNTSVYDPRLNDTVEDAFATNTIPTYVVGINIPPLVGNPNSLYNQMNDVATKGGRPKNDPVEQFYNAADGAALEAALQEIASDLPGCIVPLSPAPTEPDFVEIEVGGVAVPFVASCDAGDGWTYVNPNGPYDAVELCGAACDSLQETGQLDAVYGCPPPT